MLVLRCSLFLALAAAVVGCASADPAGPAADAPLTRAEWQTLPPDTKYEIATLERLKDGEPGLREPPAWAKFSRDVLLPAKKKDFPPGKPRP